MKDKKVLFHNKSMKEVPAKEKEWKEYAGAVRNVLGRCMLDRQNI